jgi:hypothetical protein
MTHITHDAPAALVPPKARLIPAKLENYTKTKVEKRTLVDSGDAVALALRGAELDTAYEEAAKATGKTVKELHEKYDHLNKGMQRMNLGNLIRGAEGRKADAAAKATEPKVEKPAKVSKAKAAKTAPVMTQPKVNGQV